MGLDLVVVERRLAGILREVGFLETIKSQSNDEFLKDGKSIRSTAKSIETIAQFVIDISSHIIAQNHWGVSDSYRKAIATLSSNNVIPESLSSKLQKLIAMRNILVHQYQDADYQIIWDSIDAVMKDSEDFVFSIRNYFEEIDS